MFPDQINLSHVQSFLSEELQRDAIFRGAELCYSSGLSASELQDLEMNQLRLEFRCVILIGSGAKEWGLPVGQMAFIAIQHYLNFTRPAQRCTKML